MNHIDRIKRTATIWKSLFKSNMDPYVRFKIATKLKYPKMDQFELLRIPVIFSFIHFEVILGLGNNLGWLVVWYWTKSDSVFLN